MALSVIVFAVYVWASRYWIDLIDEGYFVYLGSRVHAGDLPYRDFDSYYTPGIFYLFSWMFDLFGVSVEPIRVLMSGMRVLWGLLLFSLARRVAPWPFALLPFALVAAVDSAPVFPEPHPSWPSMLATFAAVAAIVRHQETGRRRWIVAAGALAGVAFAFKQNVGAFAALAIGVYVLLYGRQRVGKLLMAGQAGYLLLLAAAATFLLWPGLNALLAVTLWLPLLASLTLVAWGTWQYRRLDGWTTGLALVVRNGLAAGVPFLLVTLAWLVPLTAALGIHGVPWGIFVGNVNQGALILPLDPPPPGTPAIALAAIWLPIGFALLAGRRLLPSRTALVGILLVASVLSALALFIPVGGPPEEPLIEDPTFYPWLTYVTIEYGSLFLYLPAAFAWGSLLMLSVATARRRAAGPLGWYLVAGSLAALAMYPRVDVIHVMFAGPVLLVAGAAVLARIHRVLAGRAGLLTQGLVYAALLVLPVAAVSPHTYWRYVAIVHADPRSPTPPPYVELGLERAPVLVPENIANSVRGAVQYVQDGTPPGKPFFAYPVNPLFNFLADRPNPTRFNHFIAGALTPADQQDVIRDLDRAKPRYILWDHGGAAAFKVERTNGALHEYIWGCYEEVAFYSPYVILERRCE